MTHPDNSKTDPRERPGSVAAIFAAWLTKKGMNPKEAAPVLGIAVSTAYEYANGESVPTGTRAPEFAAKIGTNVAAFCKIAARARRLKQSTQRGTRNRPTAKQGQKVISANGHVQHGTKAKA